MDSVLTVLDPGMRDFLDGRNVLHALVLCYASNHVIDAVRHGLRQVFGEVIFNEIPAIAEHTNNVQIVGYNSAWQVS